LSDTAPDNAVAGAEALLPDALISRGGSPMDQFARLPLALPELQISTTPRIAIFRARSLGDLLRATPAFRALRERFPAAEITLIGLPWAADFVARSSHLDHFLPFPGWAGMGDEPSDAAELGQFLATARAAPFDLALQLHDDGAASNGFVAALGARITFGYRRGEEDRRLDWSMIYRDDEHETLRLLKLVAPLGARTPDRRPVFPVTPVEQANAAALLAMHPTRAGRWHRRLVGLHIGARDPARRWPPKRFAALGDLLWAIHGAALVLTGYATERPLADEVLRELRAPALDLVGRTDLGTFAAVIAQLDLLVTNDTGAPHLAASSGTPSVILFGPTQPARRVPLDSARHRALDARALVPWCHDGVRALRHLSADAVMTACEAQLQVRKPQVAGYGTIGAAGTSPGFANPQPGLMED
jgi:ADP-heptose:LPS heptosyltransferase